jgi:Icc protein
MDRRVVFLMFRRTFLKSALALPMARPLMGLSALGGALSVPAEATVPAKASTGDFDFVFFTDVHLGPKFDAPAACARCFDQINRSKPDFCISGGDHLFDICEQSLSEAHALFSLYRQTERELAGKIYHTVGNHDVTGINQRSPVEPGDPEYGKKLYQDHFGKLYYSFDYQGWHFVVLDSIGIEYYKIFRGEFDQQQLAWLKSDLATIKPGTPLVVVTHVPIASCLGSLGRDAKSLDAPNAANSWQVHALLAGHNLKLILQGHLHVWERMEYQDAQYVTGGSVSASWWKGTMEDGSHEGYTLCQVRNGQVHTSYVTYPWNAAAHPSAG